MIWSITAVGFVPLFRYSMDSFLSCCTANMSVLFKRLCNSGVSGFLTFCDLFCDLLPCSGDG